MNYGDLTLEQKEIWDTAYSDGYDNGYDVGWDEATSEEQDDNYDVGYNNGYIAGVEAEQKRIQFVLQMMFDSAINMGQGSKAVQYKHAMDLLKPIDINGQSDDN